MTLAISTTEILIPAKVLTCRLVSSSDCGDFRPVWMVMCFFHSKLSCGFLSAGPVARAYRNAPLTEEDKQKNRSKSKMRAKVEHAFHVLKCQFGFTKVRYRGLEKNVNHLFAAFALVNIAGVMRLRQAGMPGNDRSSEKIPH